MTSDRINSGKLQWVFLSVIFCWSIPRVFCQYGSRRTHRVIDFTWYQRFDPSTANANVVKLYTMAQLHRAASKHKILLSNFTCSSVRLVSATHYLIGLFCILRPHGRSLCVLFVVYLLLVSTQSQRKGQFGIWSGGHVGEIIIRNNIQPFTKIVEKGWIKLVKFLLRFSV